MADAVHLVVRSSCKASTCLLRPSDLPVLRASDRCHQTNQVRGLFSFPLGPSLPPSLPAFAPPSL
eukprot:3322751-Rhodomonas_salina.1